MILDEIASRVRTFWLNNPKAQRPTFGQVWDSVLAAAQDVYNATTNAGQVFSKEEVSVTYNPNQAGAQIVPASTACGKLISLHLRADLLPFFTAAPPVQYLPVERANLSNLRDNGMRSWWWTADFTNEQVAVYRNGDDWYIEVSPQPREYSRQYDLIFATGNWIQNAAIDSSPILREHHELIAMRAALPLFGKSEWTDDEERNERERARLRTDLLALLPSREASFMQYIGSLSQGRVVRRSSGISY